ncbi:MAG: TolC family protein, partial [Oscillospiraceae bacterium]|nr:TolC family protein [Oscillospiraceae bacterium]
TLNNQLNQTRENLDSLSRNIALMERRHAVGHVTARALQNARSNRTQLEAAIANMENELENLKGQVNLMLGRNFDAPLVIGNLPEAERDFMRSRDRARDLRSARNASVAISTAEMDINEQTSQWGENARRQEAMARNNLENEERTLSQRHASLIRAISDRQTNLELAEEQLELLEQTLEETQRRFNRGLVSRVDFEQAQTEVALQEIRVSAADAELFGAIRRYEWFIRGLNI